MKIFLDFDDVLFNTKAFKKDLIAIFKKNKVSKKDFLATYKDYPTVTKKGLQKYDPFEQIKRLEEKLSVNGVKIKKDLLHFLAKSSDYLFKDVKKFLQEFDKKDLYLVSYGQTGFQDKKIANCDLKKYFRKIIVTDKMKAEVIKRLVGQKEKFVFVDDRVDQVEAVKKKFPQSLTFLMKRKEGRYFDKKNEFVDYEVRNLNEVKKTIDWKLVDS
jgi:FMN phosphatase YigB (HAD superfamily)